MRAIIFISMFLSVPSIVLAEDKCGDGKSIIGGLSGHTYCLPAVNKAPMPEIAGSPNLNGRQLKEFQVDSSPGHPDVRSFRRKYGLLIPATNTSVEHELWGIIFNNQPALAGIGIHTVNVKTPKVILRTEHDLEIYRDQFVRGLDQHLVRHS